MKPAHVNSRHNFGRRSGAIWTHQAYGWWEMRSETNFSDQCDMELPWRIRYDVAQACLRNSRWWLCPNQSNGAATCQEAHVRNRWMLLFSDCLLLFSGNSSIWHQFSNSPFYQKKFGALKSSLPSPEPEMSRWRMKSSCWGRKPPWKVCPTKRGKTKGVGWDG